MGRITIISETLPARCEVCHQTDRYDKEQGYCARCTTLITNNYQYNLTNITKAQIILRPAEVIVELKDSTLTMINPTFSWDTIFGLLLFIFIAAAICYKLSIILAPILIIPLLYVLLATIINKRVIKANKEQLTVWEGPLPLGINREIKVKEIAQLYSAKGRLGDYRLKLILRQGDDIELLFNLNTEEVVKFMEQTVEKYLEIPDKPVKGELPKN